MYIAVVEQCIAVVKTSDLEIKYCRQLMHSYVPIVCDIITHWRIKIFEKCLPCWRTCVSVGAWLKEKEGFSKGQNSMNLLCHQLIYLGSKIKYTTCLLQESRLPWSPEVWDTTGRWFLVWQWSWLWFLQPSLMVSTCVVWSHISGSESFNQAWLAWSHVWVGGVS